MNLNYIITSDLEENNIVSAGHRLTGLLGRGLPLAGGRRRVTTAVSSRRASIVVRRPGRHFEVAVLLGYAIQLLREVMTRQRARDVNVAWRGGRLKSGDATE